MLSFTLPLVALLLQAAPGLAPATEAVKLYSGIATGSTRLAPVLRQMKPQEWVKAGAPAGVVAQWEAAVKDNLALAGEAQAAGKAPDRLGDALHLLEHVHEVEEEVAALLPSLSKYQNPALAELVTGIQAEGKPLRDAYAQRVMDLATEKEEQLSVVDHEAQRCRAILSREPRKSSRTVNSK